MTVFVCGHGRCGSSLVLQMIQAGGFPVFGDYPAFEPNEVSLDRTERALMPLVAGKACKILEPHLTAWTDLSGVTAIWLDRDIREQAHSQVKFMRIVGGFSLPENGWKALRDSYGPDTSAGIGRLLSAGAAVKRLSFENLLAEPAACARLIAEWIGVPMDWHAMAAQVIDRPSKCQPGVDIELSLIKMRKE